MSNFYLNFVGQMKSEISLPTQELSCFIDKYVFYNNENLNSDVLFKPICNGKIELFIHYNHCGIHFWDQLKKR